MAARLSNQSAHASIQRAHLQLEALEDRLVLSADWPGLLAPVLETSSANDTLAQAQNLNINAGQVGVVGNVGDGVGNDADVDWYSFAVNVASDFSIQTHNQSHLGSDQAPVLSLFQKVTTPAPLPDGFNPDALDIFNPTGVRLVAQSVGDATTDAKLDIKLGSTTFGPGEYFVAISGAGNEFYNAFLTDSGTFGSVGDYAFTITNTPIAPPLGPQVLSTTPTAGDTLSGSPLEIRIQVDRTLVPPTVTAATVLVQHSETGDFVNDPVTAVSLQSISINPFTNELILIPGAFTGGTPQFSFGQALKPGHYQVTLKGDLLSGPAILGLGGGPPAALGATAAAPTGQDFTFTFEVNGVEGNTDPTIDPNNPPANDTKGTAIDLGDSPMFQIIQQTGAIGDDPAYKPFVFPLANAAADVDLYRFEVTGNADTRYTFIAEVFAGRIGSPLDPALTLFKVDELGQLIEIAVNDNTQNGTQVGNTQPLFNDTVIFAGLETGEYYLAVSAAPNVSTPTPPIPNAAFNPNASRSGLLFPGVGTTGEYVLNLVVAQEDNSDPEVLETSVKEGDVLEAPPTSLTLRFDEQVNIQQLVNEGTLEGSVFFEDEFGTRIAPRLISYDLISNKATFMLLDALTGNQTLKIQGSTGLADLAGNPLADVEISFQVNADPRTDPLVIPGTESNNSLGEVQDLGTLFPNELTGNPGAIVRRDFTDPTADDPNDTADFYRFEVLQQQTYNFQIVDSSGFPIPGLDADLFLEDGTEVTSFKEQPAGSGLYRIQLPAGTYAISVDGWLAGDAKATQYDLQIRLQTAGENPTPLTNGPAPSIRIKLTKAADPNVNTPPPRLNLPQNPVIFAVGPATAPAGLTNPGIPGTVLSTLRQTPLGGERGPNTSTPSAPKFEIPGTVAPQNARPPVNVAASFVEGGSGYVPEEDNEENDGQNPLLEEELPSVEETLEQIGQLPEAALDAIFGPEWLTPDLATFLGVLATPFVLPMPLTNSPTEGQGAVEQSPEPNVEPSPVAVPETAEPGEANRDSSAISPVLSAIAFATWQAHQLRDRKRSRELRPESSDAS